MARLRARSDGKMTELTVMLPGTSIGLVGDIRPAEQIIRDLEAGALERLEALSRLKA